MTARVGDACRLGNFAALENTRTDLEMLFEDSDLIMIFFR
jgi:hypothetical protein